MRAGWSDLTRALEQAARDVRLVLADARMVAGSKIALDALPALASLRRAWEALDARLDALDGALRSAQGRDPELDLLAPRVVLLRTAVAAWIDAAARIERRDPEAELLENASDEGGSGTTDQPVHWIAATTQGAQFHATPLAPGATFARLRAQQPQAWILTSATLTVAGRFDAYLGEIGLPDAHALRWDSPFDFARQGLLYLPQTMPSPLAHDFAEQVADAAWPQIEAAGGRTFVLCSTLRAVDRVAARLRTAMDAADADFPLLVQGTSTRRALLDAFRRAGNAVLVGSISFWEGIDVRGEALSLVVIDKLPFAPPDDPLVAARIRRLQATRPQRVHRLPVAAGRDAAQAGCRAADPRRSRSRRADDPRRPAAGEVLRAHRARQPAAVRAHARCRGGARVPRRRSRARPEPRHFGRCAVRYALFG